MPKRTPISDKVLAGALIAAKGNHSAVARHLGIARQTVAIRVEKSEALRKAVHHGLMELADKAQSVIDDALERKERNVVFDDKGRQIGIELLEEPDKVAVDTAKWVKARVNENTKPTDKWSERTEITGAEGGPVSVKLGWPEPLDVEP